MDSQTGKSFRVEGNGKGQTCLNRVEEY